MRRSLYFHSFQTNGSLWPFPGFAVTATHSPSFSAHHCLSQLSSFQSALQVHDTTIALLGSPLYSPSRLSWVRGFSCHKRDIPIREALRGSVTDLKAARAATWQTVSSLARQPAYLSEYGVPSCEGFFSTSNESSVLPTLTEEGEDRR